MTDAQPSTASKTNEAYTCARPRGEDSHVASASAKAKAFSFDSAWLMGRLPIAAFCCALG
eukprot:CAMPEP_0178428064 /NCGR_PEP_ID=MMETSP0689_2-20121128/30077_1 /TAXON_ID=160604 /ORGANISM="Amphidinium massartii, Strain CS-259" /LENGTH=59 /DNA_ID=CAMNT_0020049809 /DNA_START=611 /DNA_END=786 /DNA_ORIENTATION=-